MDCSNTHRKVEHTTTTFNNRLEKELLEGFCSFLIMTQFYFKRTNYLLYSFFYLFLQPNLELMPHSPYLESLGIAQLQTETCFPETAPNMLMDKVTNG